MSSDWVSQSINQPDQLVTHTMMISRSWWVGHDNLHAAVWCVVSSFTFFSIVMTDVVCILLVKLQWKNNELLWPINLSLTQTQVHWKELPDRKKQDDDSTVEQVTKCSPTSTCTLSTSISFVNSALQKMSASSKLRPMPWKETSKKVKYVTLKNI